MGMKEFSRDETKRLVGLLGKELELFAEVSKLTERQSELIAADETEAFEASLKERQDVIDKINGLHQEVGILMQSYVSFSESAGGKKINEIESADKKLKEIIAECARINDLNIAAAKEKLGEYSKDSDKIRQSRESIGLYAQGSTTSSEIFDKMT